MPIVVEDNIKAPLYATLAKIAGLWTISNFGYYIVLPALGYEASYNENPAVIAIYFLLWAIVSTWLFWDLFSPRFKVDYHIWIYGAACLAFAGLVWALLYFFSMLPTLYRPNAPDIDVIFFATPWYFLPKSTEILVQQVLIAALVLGLCARFHSLKRVMIAYAITFGGAHIALFFLTDNPTPYTVIMTSAAERPSSRWISTGIPRPLSLTLTELSWCRVIWMSLQ